MRSLTTILLALLGSISAIAQHPVTLTPFIGENSAFDTLPARYDRSDIGVDTTVAINDSLWMSILWISDADSMPDEKGEWFHSGGLCEYIFLMTMDPRLGYIKDYREIHVECDVEQSNHNAIYYSHYLRTTTTVEVVSSKARYFEGSDEWEELVPYESRIYKVLPTGMIALAAGPGIITEPRLWKP